MDPHVSTDRGREAIVAALVAFTAQSDGHRPWMPAAVLAEVVGADSADDPQLQADVQALSAAGTVLLMAFGGAGSTSFMEAMLVPPATYPESPVD
jgi:hypothetical protein